MSPERIYLRHYNDNQTSPIDPHTLRLWRLGDGDIEYVRADLASPTPSLAAAPAIAGALFDFAGYLTSLPQPITLGASEWSAPAVDALTKWAAKRGLSLDDAEVLGWQNLLAPAAPSEGAEK